MFRQRRLILSILFLFGTLKAAAQLERVDAGQFFDTHAGSIVYIELADSQVLVFKEADSKQGLYTLHGRPLEIRAKNMEVSGTVVVRAFGDDEHGENGTGSPDTKAQLSEAGQGRGSGDNGDPGKAGDPGTPGKPGGKGTDAKTFRLYFGNVTGGGTLIFDSSGMRGGRGQDGGRGQNGQKGGKGHDRRDTDSCGTGGTGGDGGTGGQGGPGGPGGAGGDIEFGREVCSLAGIKLVSPPTTPSDPGTPGFGGLNGGEGGGGSGGGSFGQGGCPNPANLYPGADHSKERGPAGDHGKPGKAGLIKCRDCSGNVEFSQDGTPKCH